MVAMGVYDQIKKAFQDIVAPELHALRGEIRVLDQKIIALDQKIDAVDSRLTIRIDALAAQITSFPMASLRPSCSPRSGGSTTGSIPSTASCAPPSTCASGWPPSKRVFPPDRFPPQPVDRGALAPAAANPVFEYFKSRYSPESTGGCLASPWLGRHSISAS